MCVREIGLNEFAALWVAIGGRFVRCLNAKKPKGERRGFHPGEVRGEGKVVCFRGVWLREWLVLWVVIRKGILAGRCVVFHEGERWTCESGSGSGVGEVLVVDGFFSDLFRSGRS